MDWLERWQTGFIGWHQHKANMRMVKFLPKLCLKVNDTVFVPLCGKTLDMIFFLEQGFKVIGVELSELAVEQFFKENKIVFKKDKVDGFILFSGENIKIYCGDVFNLTAQNLAKVNAVYDRASLIALNTNLRQSYVKHLLGIMPEKIKWLLLTMNYPQDQKEGPPFAVAQEEVKKLFKECQYQQLEKIDDLKNEKKFIEAKVDFLEKSTYLLTK
jgi:thiopurine S-methyltransferase